MSRYQLTPQAADDLFEIWSYIARDNVAAAQRVEDAIFEACSSLAEGPRRGHSRDDLTQLPLLFWTVHRFPNYISHSILNPILCESSGFFTLRERFRRSSSKVSCDFGAGRERGRSRNCASAARRKHAILEEQ